MIISIRRDAGRYYIPDGSFIELALREIPKDPQCPHGFRYRFVWVQVLENGVHRRRVLFDNHSGKSDHYHLDKSEYPYDFKDLDQLYEDFAAAIRKLGGPI
jgi:hypothetical protein